MSFPLSRPSMLIYIRLRCLELLRFCGCVRLVVGWSVTQTTHSPLIGHLGVVCSEIIWVTLFLVLLRRVSALPRLLQSFLELLRQLILLLALVGVIFGWKLIPLLFCWLLRISLWFLNILGSYGSIV